MNVTCIIGRDRKNERTEYHEKVKLLQKNCQNPVLYLGSHNQHHNDPIRVPPRSRSLPPATESVAWHTRPIVPTTRISPVPRGRRTAAGRVIALSHSPRSECGSQTWFAPRSAQEPFLCVHLSVAEDRRRKRNIRRAERKDIHGMGMPCHVMSCVHRRDKKTKVEHVEGLILYCLLSYRIVPLKTALGNGTRHSGAQKARQD